ncbi:c-type cytochrome [Salinibius halmophilus]|uniref:c-type cytochrome n=1 Tax=Salinibius halmophilus TaxID=1853216 RepID=UPI000E66DC0B|nr:cytochrome c [Salinibius halmophilus]
MKQGLQIWLLLVLALPMCANSAEAGQHVYSEHCASCHGKNPEVVTFADLRGISEGELAFMISGGGQMPAVPLTPEEFEQLLAYLANLEY